MTKATGRPQSSRLLAALKTTLRASGHSYADVAQHLGLAESSVKRLFSRGGWTLERVEAVCDLAETDLLELARAAETGRRRLTELTEDQERELLAEPVLILVAICTLNRWSFADILATYRLGEPELVGLLIRLERIGLLELMPGNRIRLRVARTFAWRRNGPIQKYFMQHVQNDFLSGEFHAERDAYRFSWGMLSPESFAAIREQINALLERFDATASSDEVRPIADTLGSSLLVAFRHWEPAAFAAMRRDG